MGSGSSSAKAAGEPADEATVLASGPVPAPDEVRASQSTPSPTIRPSSPLDGSNPAEPGGDIEDVEHSEEDVKLVSSCFDVLSRELCINMVPEECESICSEMLERIAEPSESHPFKQKGDAPDGIYIIKAGRMRVHVGSANVAVLDKGHVFGELSALGCTNEYTVSISCQDKVILLWIPQALVSNLLGRIGGNIPRDTWLKWHVRQRYSDTTAVFDDTLPDQLCTQSVDKILGNRAGTTNLSPEMMEVLRGNLVLHQNGSVLSDGNHGLLMQTFFVLRGSIIRNDRDGRYIQTLCTDQFVDPTKCNEGESIACGPSGGLILSVQESLLEQLRDANV